VISQRLRPHMDNDERHGHSGAAALRGLDPIEAEAIRAEGLDLTTPRCERRSILCAGSWNCYGYSPPCPWDEGN
jgi:hypothetical protein